MFGINFIKASPTTFILHFQNGKIKRSGAGLSFFYYSPTSTLVAVPLSSIDVPFVFNEVSLDYQSVTIQGQLTYRISDPKGLAGLLDFSIRSSGAYISDDPGKLNERLISLTQVLASAITHRLSLREALLAFEPLSNEVLAGLRASESVKMLGVELLGLSILAIKPSPEMAKALETEAREGLLRQADEAVYARRNASVEQERKIKESELNTEIAVAEKTRQIRETKMAADIALEQQRSALIDRQVGNQKKEAESKAFALEAMVKPIRELDWRTLMAMGAGGANAKLGIAMAFQQLAENAQKIGQLTITPDLLQSLLADAPRKPEK